MNKTIKAIVAPIQIGHPLIKLIISPKPNDGLLICVENQTSASPIFLDRDGKNLIEPIIEMIALLARRESQS